MKKFLQEFKDFAMCGSVIDFAGRRYHRGVLFKKYKFIGKIDPFRHLCFLQKTALMTSAFRLWVSPSDTVRLSPKVINFIIMAFVIFLLVKALNSLAKLHGHTEDDDPTTKQCPFVCPKST